MPFAQLSDARIRELAGSNHAVVGAQIPLQGMQPYYGWLMRTLDLLFEASAGGLRVAQDADLSTAVWIAPGRASFAGQAVAYAGGQIDLASYNNATAYIWLYENSGSAAIGTGLSGSGWPTGDHLKLAQVTLAAGVITQVIDRRFESAFEGGYLPASTARRGAVKQCAVDADLVDQTGGTPGSTLAVATNLDALTDQTTGTADDQVANVGTAVTGVDGSGSNAASKSDVDARLTAINNNFKELTDQIITQRALNTVLINAVSSLAGDLNDLRAKMRTAGLLAQS